MLEQNDYVRCLMVDFTKASDTVDHVILLSKLAQLKPTCLCNKLDLFISDRKESAV